MKRAEISALPQSVGCRVSKQTGIALRDTKSRDLRLDEAQARVELPKPEPHCGCELEY